MHCSMRSPPQLLTALPQALTTVAHAEHGCLTVAAAREWILPAWYALHQAFPVLWPPDHCRVATVAVDFIHDCKVGQTRVPGKVRAVQERHGRATGTTLEHVRKSVGPWIGGWRGEATLIAQVDNSEGAGRFNEACCCQLGLAGKQNSGGWDGCTGNGIGDELVATG